MLFKYIIKSTAQAAGKTVTFMPKPLFGDNGNGMHCHQSHLEGRRAAVLRRGRLRGPVGHRPRTTSAACSSTRPSLLAFTNPTANSYHRLVPGFEAPVNLVYSQRNRSACARIPITGTNPKAKRVEFRVPDPSCNPYLAFAAMLMAGLDGIKNKIEPPEPVDKDLYELPPDEAAAIPQVPGSLDAVLDTLEADHAFLTEGGVFTDDLIETWLDYKRTVELDAAPAAPAPARVRALLRLLTAKPAVTCVNARPPRRCSAAVPCGQRRRHRRRRGWTRRCRRQCGRTCRAWSSRRRGGDAPGRSLRRPEAMRRLAK